ELVDFVGGAILGQLFEVEDFAHGHAHDWNSDPVPGLVDPLFAFVRPHLAAPSIAGEGCEFRALDPVQRLESEARRIASGIAVPAPRLRAAFHHAGAYDNEIATLDRNTLFARSLVEVSAGDAVTVIKGVDALKRATSSRTPRPTILFLVFSMPHSARPR